MFTLAFNTLLLVGFGKKKFFFDLFIGLFLWLGFWLKYSFGMIFKEGFFDLMGMFNTHSGLSHDRALLVSTVAASALLLATYLRRKLVGSDFFVSREENWIASLGFYKKYRNYLIGIFLFLAIIAPALNAYYGFYQRGSIPKTILPFGLNGIFTWIILFGLCSFFAVLINYEMKLTKKITLWFVLIGFMEILFSNLSMLSRGIVFNGSALFFGINANFKNLKMKGQARLYVSLITILILLMAFSIISVNLLRSNVFYSKNSAKLDISISYGKLINIAKSSTVLFIDRWVGIEGVMAVSSYNKLGLELWNKAWNEKYHNSGTSFYDLNLIETPYTSDINKELYHHFISLPGIIAFMFYLGNYYVLFLLMFTVGILGSVIELFVLKFGGNNLILASLLSEVVASRFAHFGYVPAQSYLLFGTIVGNVMILYIGNEILKLSTFKKSITV